MESRKRLSSRLKEVRTGALRGSKSRNKVSVGEPAEGSLSMLSQGKDKAPWPYTLDSKDHTLITLWSTHCNVRALRSYGPWDEHKTALALALSLTRACVAGSTGMSGYEAQNLYTTLSGGSLGLWML